MARVCWVKTRKFIVTNWVHLVPILISLFALDQAHNANLSTVTANERANSLAEKASIAIVEIDDIGNKYDIYSEKLDVPCLDESGRAKWEKEYILVFRIRNTGGKIASIEDISWETSIESSQGFIGTVTHEYFVTRDNFDEWIFNNSPDYFWPHGFVDSVRFNGFDFDISPSSFELLVVRVHQSIIVNSNIPSGLVNDFLYRSVWATAYFHFADARKNPVPVEVNIFSPEIYTLDPSGNYSRCIFH
jgi:hypothetical protein